MTPYCLVGTLILPNRVVPRGYIECAQGRIMRVGTGRPRGPSGTVVDLGTHYLAPGFVDIHVHGGEGADYMDGTVAAVRQANRAHLARGTTTLCPTTTTGTPAEVGRMLTACGRVARTWTPDDGARIAGIHLYGPYFAETKVGCHPRDGRRDPVPAEYARYFATGLVRVATCAAELPGAEAFYREARRHGCLVTCGHSDAGWPELARGYAAGMRHVDHFWCAMSSVPSVRARLGTPMRGSMEQFVIAHPEMSTEVIADGRHLAPELLEYAWRLKGAARLCLVTDANRALGMPPGRYRFGHAATGSWFESDGEVGFVAGEGLASSVVGLDTMIQVMRRDTPAPLEDVIRMASLTPAERAGIDDRVGSIAVGKMADIVVLDEDLRVRQVYLAGKVVSPTSQTRVRPVPGPA